MGQGLFKVGNVRRPLPRSLNIVRFRGDCPMESGQRNDADVSNACALVLRMPHLPTLNKPWGSRKAYNRNITTQFVFSDLPARGRGEVGFCEHF